MTVQNSTPDPVGRGYIYLNRPGFDASAQAVLEFISNQAQGGRVNRLISGIRATDPDEVIRQLRINRSRVQPAQQRDYDLAIGVVSRMAELEMLHAQRAHIPHQRTAPITGDRREVYLQRAGAHAEALMVGDAMAALRTLPLSYRDVRLNEQFAPQPNRRAPSAPAAGVTTRPRPAVPAESRDTVTFTDNFNNNGYARYELVAPRDRAASLAAEQGAARQLGAAGQPANADNMIRQLVTNLAATQDPAQRAAISNGLLVWCRTRELDHIRARGFRRADIVNTDEEITAFEQRANASVDGLRQQPSSDASARVRSSTVPATGTPERAAFLQRHHLSEIDPDIQLRLERLGHSTGRRNHALFGANGADAQLDGLQGQMTTRAIQAIQRANGIEPADGQLNDATRAKIIELSDALSAEQVQQAQTRAQAESAAARPARRRAPRRDSGAAGAGPTGTPAAGDIRSQLASELATAQAQSSDSIRYMETSEARLALAASAVLGGKTEAEIREIIRQRAIDKLNTLPLSAEEKARLAATVQVGDGGVVHSNELVRVERYFGLPQNGDWDLQIESLASTDRGAAAIAQIFRNSTVSGGAAVADNGPPNAPGGGGSRTRQ